MMRQYFDIKRKVGDAILFFRLGDFYEMFYDDAKLVSKELDLTLTGKECGQEERAPMCGVPYHASEIYIGRLIKKGYKVAICEQMEDPALAKGLVKRDIIRMVTPGTVTESSMLDETKNNFICAVFATENRAGLCFADISTGEVHATTAVGSDLGQTVINEMGRFSPSEALLDAGATALPGLVDFLRLKLNCAVESMPLDAEESPENTIEAQFGKTTEALGIADDAECIAALGALIRYLHDSLKSDLSYIKNLDRYSSGEFLGLDISARKNLEITSTIRTGEKRGSLLWVLDKTKSAMGGRLICSWLEKPLLNVAEIRRRLNSVGELVSNTEAREEIMETMRSVLDIERIIGKIVYRTAGSRDLRALCQTLTVIPDIKAQLTLMKSAGLREINAELDPIGEIARLIDSAIVEEPPFSVREGGFIKKGYNAEVDRLHEILSGGKGIIAAMEASEREKTGIKNLKIGYNKVFGYYIDVSRSYQSMVPENYIRRQTLANSERYITEELKKLEEEILGAEEKVVALEYRLFTEICDQVSEQSNRIQLSAAALAKIDVFCSFAEVSARNNYCMPEVDDSDRIDIRDGRHPVVEIMMKDALFVPNDTYLGGKDDRMLIITGPNMAGKSTYMRQTALILLMAQCGCFVPAKSATLGVVDKVFTRIGASDDLSSGQSTFMVEMSEVAYILKNATRHSLIIYDEIGRGTSTFDGMSIAKAVLEYTANTKTLGAKTLFATHYHELAALEGIIDGVKNYNIAVKKHGKDITFLRKIIRGGEDNSYGIEVARLAGIPDRVTERAHEILDELENGRESGRSVNVKTNDEPQISLGGMEGTELVGELAALSPETLTPIEALNVLYDFVNRAKRI